MIQGRRHKEFLLFWIRRAERGALYFEAHRGFLHIVIGERMNFSLMFIKIASILISVVSSTRILEYSFS